jgi:hypothetical protein
VLSADSQERSDFFCSKSTVRRTELRVALLLVTIWSHCWPVKNDNAFAIPVTLSGCDLIAYFDGSEFH